MAVAEQTEKYVAVKKVDPVSMGKYIAGVYLLIFVILGAFMMIGGLFALLAGKWQIVLIGIGVATLGAAFYAAIGFVAGVVGGFIYNVVASKTGGIRMVLE